MAEEQIPGPELRMLLREIRGKQEELCERTERIENRTESIETELIGRVGTSKVGLKEQFRGMRADVERIKRDSARRRGYLATAVLSAFGSLIAAAFAWWKHP